MWAAGEGAAVGVGRLHDEGEEDGAQKSNNGEDNKRERAHSTDVAECVFGRLGVTFWVVAEVDFADPGCAIEEEGKPA